MSTLTFPYAVIYNGVFYSANTPIEVPEEEPEKDKDEVQDEEPEVKSKGRKKQ